MLYDLEAICSAIIRDCPHAAAATSRDGGAVIVHPIGKPRGSWSLLHADGRFETTTLRSPEELTIMRAALDEMDRQLLAARVATFGTVDCLDSCSGVVEDGTGEPEDCPTCEGRGWVPGDQWPPGDDDHLF
jgi:hypothetical protein